MLTGDVSPLARLVIITSVPRLKMSSMNLRVGSRRVGELGQASPPRRSLPPTGPPAAQRLASSR